MALRCPSSDIRMPGEGPTHPPSVHPHRFGPPWQDVTVIDWLQDRSVIQLLLLAFAIFVVLAVGAGLLTRVLVRRGMRAPFVIHRITGSPSGSST